MKKPKKQGNSFGEWLRWTVARRGLERAELARKLGVSTKTVTNLLRRESPDGVSDVTISRLASLLEMDEPALLVAWRNGRGET